MTVRILHGFDSPLQARGDGDSVRSRLRIIGETLTLETAIGSRCLVRDPVQWPAGSARFSARRSSTIRTVSTASMKMGLPRRLAGLSQGSALLGGLPALWSGPAPLSRRATAAPAPRAESASTPVAAVVRGVAVTEAEVRALAR